MTTELNIFKGKDIDEVLKALKQAGEAQYASDLQEKFLPDWQRLKVEAIFEYLCTNKRYNYRFEVAKYSVDYGYCLQYNPNEWDDDLNKGGFEAFWQERETILQKIKGTLSDYNLPVDTTIKIFSTISSLF